VICPCPLIVTEAFMDDLGIDLVVHGFANDADAARQREFFEIPINLGNSNKSPTIMDLAQLIGSATSTKSW
jgi:hypothetical protein